MRLGVLMQCFSYEEFTSDEQAVLDLLHAKNVDVVLGHEGRESDAPNGAEQAKRLARADVDGALVLPLWRDAAAVALHLAGVPLLWAESDKSIGAVYDALTQLGAPVDRLLVPSPQRDEAAQTIEDWLRENSKSERQRGQEAALKLYGRTMGHRGDPPLPDPTRWLTQFGVSLRQVSQAWDAPDDKETPVTDFGGDAHAVGGIHAILTQHLLQLVSGADTGATTALRAFSFGEPTGEPATFAAITRIGDRFRCVVLRGAADETGAPPRLAPAHQSLVSPALSGGLDVRWLSYIAGDHVGALRAACRALDIEAVVLR